MINVAYRGVYTTPEEDNSAVDVFYLCGKASERDRLFRKVYYRVQLVDDFTRLFIIPHAGLHGAVTRQRDDGRLASPRVGDNDERQEQDGCDVVHTLSAAYFTSQKTLVRYRRLLRLVRRARGRRQLW